MSENFSQGWQIPEEPFARTSETFTLAAKKVNY